MSPFLVKTYMVPKKDPLAVMKLGGIGESKITTPMILTLYPNNELRVLLATGKAPSQADHNEKVRESSALLDIPSQPSQANQRKDYKRHPLRQKARHKIIHHGGLFSEDSKDRQLFLTGTLPGSTDSAMSEFTRLAPYVVKIVQTYLPRSCGCSASELKYLWVWELQKRGALHMHVIVECRDRATAEELHDGWEGIWVSALRAADAKAGVDIFERWYGGSWSEDESQWQIKAEFVKKSVARYLAKYESKGSDGDSKYFPPRWYGISTALRAAYGAYLQENTERTPDMVSPDIPKRAPRILLRRWLEWFCGRKATEKHDWGDSYSVDCFSYAPTGVTLKDAWDSLTRFCREFDIIRPFKLKERPKMTIAQAVRRVNRAVDRRMAPDQILELSYMITAPIWNRLQNESTATRDDFLEYNYSFKYWLSLKGFTVESTPVWAREIFLALEDGLLEEIAPPPSAQPGA